MAFPLLRNEVLERVHIFSCEVPDLRFSLPKSGVTTQCSVTLSVVQNDEHVTTQLE